MQILDVDTYYCVVFCAFGICKENVNDVWKLWITNFIVFYNSVEFEWIPFLVADYVYRQGRSGLTCAIQIHLWFIP